MQVRVDRARDDGLAGELDDWCARPDGARNCRIIANRHETPATHRHGLRDVPVVVDRDDVAAAQHEVGGLREGGGGKEGQDNRETKKHGELLFNPHPEEPCKAWRLEGWPGTPTAPAAILRDAPCGRSSG